MNHLTALARTVRWGTNICAEAYETEVMITWIVDNKLWLILLVGVVFNSYWIYQYGRKLQINWWLSILLSIVHMICAVLCTKLFALIEGASGGMSSYGGLFFLPILFCLSALATKRSVTYLCDLFTIPSIVIVFCARCNCMLSGCCLGAIIPGTNEVRWPIREIELLFYVVLYLVLRNKIAVPRFKGKLCFIYMISYGVFRFIFEWLRDNDAVIGVFHMAHIWSLLAIFIGTAVIYMINKFNFKTTKSYKYKKTYEKETH